MAPGTPQQIVRVFPLIVLVVLVTVTAVVIGNARGESRDRLVRSCGFGLVAVGLLVVFAASFADAAPVGLHGGEAQLVPTRTLRFYLRGEPARSTAVRNLVFNVGLLVPVALGIRLAGLRAAQALLVVVAVAVVNEVGQLFVGRSSDVDDVILNSLGGFAAVAACHVVIKRLEGQRAPRNRIS